MLLNGEVISGLPPYRDQPPRPVALVPGHQRVREHERVGERALRRAVGDRPSLCVLEEHRQPAGSARAHRADSGRHPPHAPARRAGRASRPMPSSATLEIGITIAGGADVIMLDEPTAGMSHAETERAVALIRRLTEGTTLLIVEHDMSVVFGLADRISVLVYGHIIASGTPEEIRARSEGQGSLSRRGGALMLEVRDLHAYYGKSHILQGVDMRYRRRRGREPARAQRRRPLHDGQGHHGRGCRRRARSGSRARTLPACRATGSRISASVTCPNIATSSRA